MTQDNLFPLCECGEQPRANIKSGRDHKGEGPYPSLYQLECSYCQLKTDWSGVVRHVIMAWEAMNSEFREIQALQVRHMDEIQQFVGSLSTLSNQEKGAAILTYAANLLITACITSVDQDESSLNEVLESLALMVKPKVLEAWKDFQAERD